MLEVEDLNDELIRLGPNKIVLTKHYLNYFNDIEELEVFDDDVWVISHPKTGTTWTQEMVWCIANDLDFEDAKRPLGERFPFLEHGCTFDLKSHLKNSSDSNTKLSFVVDSLKCVLESKRPRFIKTHLPWCMLPKQIREGLRKPKIIYVARNAKDTCVSYYHHYKLLMSYTEDFPSFAKAFMRGEILWGPFWLHILEFWEKNNEPNILFLKYEDMKKDLGSVILQTAKFLDKSYSDEEVKQLQEHLNFENMKKNKSVNFEDLVTFLKEIDMNKNSSGGQFMRSGKVNSWKEEMNEEMVQEFDSWIEENLKGKDLKF